MIVNRPGHTMCWKHAEKHRLFVIETDYTRATARMVIGPWQTVVEEIETNFVAWPIGVTNSVTPICLGAMVIATLLMRD